MKRMKRMMAVVLAIVVAATMSLGMCLTAFAAADKPEEGTITITTPAETNDDETVTYNIYKIFDATVNETTGAVVYKLKEGVSTVPDGFTADSNGYITAAPDSLEDTTTAFKNYAGKGDAVDSPTATGPNATATSKTLEPGYYYVETSTGAAVIVTPGGNTPVNDKNELSTLVKSAGTEYDAAAKKAIAAVGTDQPFTVVVTKKHGATKLVVSDTMEGMTYNGDLTVEGAEAANYTVNGAEGASSFTVTFDTDFVKGLDDGATLTLHYTGKVTSDALQTDPGKNTATLTTDNDHEVSDEVEVYNAKITIIKVDGSSAPLAGAGFTLTGPNGYEEEIPAGETTTFEWKGLAAGEYTLEETTVPDGYNKAENITFTIEDGNYDAGNLIQGDTVVNQAGPELPSTGGIGTTLFYIIGALLIVGAGILLIARRRMHANN